MQLLLRPAGSAAPIFRAVQTQPPQMLVQPMEERPLLKPPAAAAGAVLPDRQAQPRLLLRCWAAPQLRSQQRWAAHLLVVERRPTLPLRRSMAKSPRRNPLPLAQPGKAQATAQTNFGSFQSVQSTSTAPSSGTPASAIVQAGGVVSPSNPIIPGQSFSVVSGSGFGPLTVANGSMGAGFGGINGISITYRQSVGFTQNGGAFVLDLLSSDALGIGFDTALFQILVNSAVIDSQSFTLLRKRFS
jgi:hypothetical protein